MNWKLILGIALLAGGLMVISVGAEVIDLEPVEDPEVESTAVETPEVVVNAPHNVCPTPNPWRNHW